MISGTALPTSISTKRWILLSVGVGAFMSAFNGSSVGTVLPVMQHSLGTDVGTIQWVVTIFLLITSGLLLSVGRLGDLQGQKTVYVTGFVVFVAGSGLCAVAPSALALIAFRAVQALGGAMIFANAPAILTKNFPAAQRGQVLGLQATMTYLGLTVGPSLGGWLTDLFGWRSVFFVNIPLALLAIWLSVRFIPDDTSRGYHEPFDVPGAAAFMAGLVFLLLGLNRGNAWGWTSLSILLLLGLAGVILTLFVAIERRTAHPMLDLALFGQRMFSAATGSAVLNYMCLNMMQFLLPFYLIQGRQISAGRAGLLFTAQPLVMAVAAPISGALSDRVGSRLPSTLGMAILSVGLFVTAQLGPQSSLWHVVLGLTVIGLGIGIFISPNSSALMGSAPQARQGIAAGILATARHLGMVLGIGLAGAILTTVQGQASSAASTTLLFQGTHVGLLVAGAIALLGVITSAVRGR